MHLHNYPDLEGNLCLDIVLSLNVFRNATNVPSRDSDSIELKRQVFWISKENRFRPRLHDLVLDSMPHKGRNGC